MELPRNPAARRGPDTSPDRAKLSAQPRVKPFRKVQIIYYLCRNGQLEHPHFMELTHLPNHNLRLKDVIQRLTVLRGRGMPSLYSWSCKRIYKNGYVWNDLAEDDVIHPAEGAEYVLKGSEIVTRPTETTRRPPASPPPTQLRNLHHGQESEAEEDTPNSTCSRGVSTDMTVGGSPSSSSEEELHKKDEVYNGSRLEEEEGELQKRVPSMVLRFITCGSSAAGFDFVGKPPARELAVSNSSGRMEEECFSGSMEVEMAEEGNVRGSGPFIKRSTSSDEDRSNHYSSRLREAVEEEGEERSVRGKCMPSRNWKRSSVCPAGLLCTKP